MIRVLIAIVASLLLVSGANAQSFPGYGPAGGLYVAQGNSALPTWLFLNGDCTSTVGALVTCTKTNGVPFYTGLSSPINPTDAATKLYVDSNSTGLTIHTAAALATAAALPTNTYNNGTAGVGATLTATGNGALSVDGTVVTSAQRVLVKNEAAPANNGIYTVTTVGTGGTPYVLTRTTDANTAGTQDPNKIGNGSYVLVAGGATQLNTAWVVNSTVTTIGTDAISWTQFSASSGVSSIGGQQGAFTCATGMLCIGNVIYNGVGTAPEGRLTLQTGTPVMLTTQAAKTTIFYDCYRGGNLVPVFNGTVDILLPITACEVSDTMSAAGASAIGASGVFDVWAVNVGGALTLCVATNNAGGGWASDTAGSNTARGTGYSALDKTTRSFITNKNALATCYSGATNRGSIAVNQATYLGTIATDAIAGQVTWRIGSLGSGVATASPSFPPAVLSVFNAYNRVTVFSDYVYRSDLATFTAANQTTFIWDGLSVVSVDGLGEEPQRVHAKLYTQSTSASSCFMGIGFDSSTNILASSILNSSLGGGVVITILQTEFSPVVMGVHAFFQSYSAQAAGGCVYTPNSPALAGIAITARM